MQSHDDTFKTWNDWLSKITKEVQVMLSDQYIFREIQAIVAENSNIHKSSVFYDWLTAQYTATITISVRRQIDLDRDKNCISLARLLSEIKEKPDVLTRSRFVKSWATLDYSDPEALGNASFDDIAGVNNNCVLPQSVDEELSQLRTNADLLKCYADRRIAHSDKRSLDKLPTTIELDDCLNYIEALVIKYHKLLTGNTYIRLRPEYLEDWKDIFHHPWITVLQEDE